MRPPTLFPARPRSRPGWVTALLTAMTMTAAVAVPAAVPVPVVRGPGPAAAVSASRCPSATGDRVTGVGAPGTPRLLMTRAGLLVVGLRAPDGTPGQTGYTVVVQQLTTCGHLVSRVSFGPYDLAGHPAATLDAAGDPVVVFAARSAGSASAVGQSVVATATPDGAGVLRWTLVAGSASRATDLHAGDGAAVAYTDDGVVSGRVTDHEVRLHLGQDPEVPAASPDVVVASVADLSYLSGLALLVDRSTGTERLWAVWYEHDTVSHEVTLRVRLDPLHAGPGFSTVATTCAGAGGCRFAPPPVQVAASGPWVLAPSGGRLVLRGLDQRGLLVVPGARGTAAHALTTTGDGRLWVVFSQHDRLHAMRLDDATTRFGADSVRADAGAATTRHLDATGGTGPLYVLGVGTDAGVDHGWLAQVRAGLGVATAVAGRRVRLTVRDAGTPVAGAVVRHARGGRVGTTGPRGRVTCVVGPGLHRLVVSRAGYRTRTVTVRVR